MLLNALQTAMVQAGLVTEPQVENTTARRQWVSRRKWGHSRTRRMVSWEHELFGSVQITSSNFSLDSSTRQEGPNTWSRLYAPKGRPENIQLDFTGYLKSDVCLLHAAGGLVTDMGTRNTFPPFEVPITYVGEENHMRTREKDRDNIDLVFLKLDGSFVELQVSVVMRRDLPYLCVQEIYGGQVAATTPEIAEELGIANHKADNDTALIVIPLYDECAFPDHEDVGIYRNYLKIFPKMGPKVLDFAYKRKAVAGLAACTPAYWQPQWPELTERQTKNGWVSGVVTFYNLVIGWGFAICRVKDGENGTTIPVFVHFSSILDKTGKPVMSNDELPVLQPMTGVILKYKEEGGKRRATAVQVP